MNNFFKQSAVVILLSSLLFAIQLFAFTEPSSPPPGSNTPAPLHVGSQGQTKTGGLILNTGGAPLGFIVDQGSVGIGTQNPSQKLDVAGYIRAATGLCIGSDCRTGWPSSSGGTITSLGAGSGISFSPNPITTSGTISVNTGATIYSVECSHYSFGSLTLASTCRNPVVDPCGGNNETIPWTYWGCGVPGCVFPLDQATFTCNNKVVGRIIPY